MMRSGPATNADADPSPAGQGGLGRSPSQVGSPRPGRPQPARADARVRPPLKGRDRRRVVAPTVGALGAAVFLLAAPAEAHTGLGHVDGVVHGFLHPLGGLDHILAMVAVGVIAARIGGRALWLVPASFVTLMAVGAAAAMAGIGLPFVETGIGLSVLVFGLLLAAQPRLPVALAAAIVGAFAIFHGHAHGSEMGEDWSGYSYGLGFVAATALLHAAGIGIGLLAGRIGPAAIRVAGAATAAAGVALLTGLA